MMMQVEISAEKNGFSSDYSHLSNHGMIAQMVCACVDGSKAKAQPSLNGANKYKTLSSIRFKFYILIFF